MSDELALFDVGTPRARLTETALVLPDDLTFDEWTDIGGRLTRAALSSLWWLGDWWAFGEHHYGERARVVGEQVRYAFQTCVNAGAVARRFETNRRQLVLTWAHHAEAASVPSSIADHFLEAAIAQGWTVKQLRQQIREWRRAQRVITHVDLASVSSRYPVLYVDPPWRYEHPPSDSRAIENQYPTMTLDELAAEEYADRLPIAEDAVMFCWATSPKLAEALTLIDAWGLTYRTCMVWVKDKIGMGYYARQQHELLLIATRGELPTPAPAARPSSVVEAPRGKHSAKPEIFYELIERMYPDLPRVELFARSERDGWAAWGNEVAA